MKDAINSVTSLTSFYPENLMVFSELSLRKTHISDIFIPAWCMEISLYGDLKGKFYLYGNYAFKSFEPNQVALIQSGTIESFNILVGKIVSNYALNKKMQLMISPPRFIDINLEDSFFDDFYEIAFLESKGLLAIKLNLES